MAITRGIARAVAKRGSAQSTSTAPPTGNVSPPLIAMRPFGPSSTPGVARPWTASSAAINEKPPAITTVRTSARRVPTIVSAAAAAVATSAVTPTP